jgi:hypothetical protein
MGKTQVAKREGEGKEGSRKKSVIEGVTMLCI